MIIYYALLAPAWAIHAVREATAGIGRAFRPSYAG
jgi:hypothetical protein